LSTSRTRCIAANPGRVPVTVSTFDDGFTNVEAGNCDFFFNLGGQVLFEANGRHCDTLIAVGHPFFETSVGFVLPRQSNLTDTMSMETLRLREENQLVNSTQYAHQFVCHANSSSTLVCFAAYLWVWSSVVDCYCSQFLVTICRMGRSNTSTIFMWNDFLFQGWDRLQLFFYISYTALLIMLLLMLLSRRRLRGGKKKSSDLEGTVRCDDNDASVMKTPQSA
jgi:hypothetical protein